MTTHVGLFNQGPTLYPGVDAFKAGASLVIQAMLQSPYFLYRTELGTAAAGAATVALNDWEVGAKLALAITNTIPDDTLLAAAAAGKLHDAAGVREQANRLLDGATGADGVSNFNLQVYRLGAYDGITRTAADFPEFTVEHPRRHEDRGAAVPELGLPRKPRDQRLLHCASRLRELVARAALRRDGHLFERSHDADEGRSGSDAAFRFAHAAGLPVVLHLRR